MNAPSGPDPAVMEAIERGSAVVFFDVALGDGENAKELGRIKMELFVKDVRLCCKCKCRSGCIQHLTSCFLCSSAPKRARTFVNFALESIYRTNNLLATKAAAFIVLSKDS
jgi:hypothetical protein